MSAKEVCEIILNNLKDVDLQNVRKQTFRSEWISVKDRLPLIDKRYLTYDIYNHILIRHYRNKGKRFSNMKKYSEMVTHWMPLPEPPK